MTACVLRNAIDDVRAMHVERRDLVPFFAQLELGRSLTSPAEEGGEVVDDLVALEDVLVVLPRFGARAKWPAGKSLTWREGAMR